MRLSAGSFMGWIPCCRHHGSILYCSYWSSATLESITGKAGIFTGRAWVSTRREIASHFADMAAGARLCWFGASWGRRLSAVCRAIEAISKCNGMSVYLSGCPTAEG